MIAIAVRPVRQSKNGVVVLGDHRRRAAYAAAVEEIAKRSGSHEVTALKFPLVPQTQPRE
jgi:hypothetical protein